jgi:sulfur-carrier protein adenylyltransferase/sulfurtransferase
MDPLTSEELARYSRHVLLPEIGQAGQTQLKNAKVLIVGAGGLGSPAALYLAAAGVGTLGIADFDKVEASNLHRQLLHRDQTVGLLKTESAANRLRETNPHPTIRTHPDGVMVSNAVQLFAQYDVIVDGTDNFNSRYLNSDAALITKRPLVFGSVYRFEGQVSVFAPHLGGPCYRCLFPQPPPVGSVPGCGEVGVMGALCGVIGCWQALEVIKLITDAGTPLIGKLLTYDALNQQTSTLSIPALPNCRCDAAAGPPPTKLTPPDYTNAIGEPSLPASVMNSAEHPLEISVHETKQLLDNPAVPTELIDVREPHEFEICKIKGATFIPMRQIPENVAELPRDKRLLVYCHHGARSLRVVQYLRDQGLGMAINVAGGIDAWAGEIEPDMLRY